MKSNEILREIEKEVERFNQSFSLDNQDEAKAIRNDASTEIEGLVSDYNKLSRYESYREFMSSEKPLETAILTLSLPSFKVRTLTNDEGVVTGMDVNNADGNLNTVEKTIDLLDFDKYSGWMLANRKGWQYELERFNQLMCLKVALELGLAKGKLDKIKKTYFLTKVAEKIECGETPTSNTQALKALQGVIDAIIFDDDGNGKNKYKATSHDIAYLDHLIAKRGKALLTVSVVNSKTTRELVTHIIYRILTNGKYDVDYKKKKNA